MKKLLAVLISLSLVTVAYAQKTKTQMNNEVNTNFPDNTTGLITPAILRTTILDIIQSYIDLNGATNFTCAANTFASAVTLNAFTCSSQGLGTGLVAQTATQIQSNAFDHIAFQPGWFTNIASVNRFTAFTKVASQSIVDNLSGSSLGFSCSVNPVISIVECGSSNVCTTPVATIGTVTVTQQGQLAQGTITNQTVTAGDYVAWIVGPGTCTNTNLMGSAQLHAL